MSKNSLPRDAVGGLRILMFEPKDGGFDLQAPSIKAINLICGD